MRLSHPVPSKKEILQMVLGFWVTTVDVGGGASGTLRKVSPRFFISIAATVICKSRKKIEISVRNTITEIT